jgi:hypothetical protein
MLENLAFEWITDAMGLHASPVRGSPRVILPPARDGKDVSSLALLVGTDGVEHVRQTNKTVRKVASRHARIGDLSSTNSLTLDLR